ncbi:hypothetical protein Q4E40_08460 [Pontibacter sp. BT731]|uniref:hypothetical protein n=1 Tax=Pontibacter coccineus TaxID=3063328 RepID=UPI0026E3EB3F|nr:hypothetical protein [Pontibacter sp. BT731]MDO6390155.1 hypothetical protein [Pontibacter sp. BT731]
MNRFIPVCFLLVICGCGRDSSLPDSQDIKKQPSSTQVAAELDPLRYKPNTDYAYPKLADMSENEDSLLVTFNGYKYYIFGKGAVIEKNIHDNSLKKFQLQTELFVENAYLHHLDGDLLIYYTDTDGENAGSAVELINRETGKIKYSSRVNGFNLGQPIIVDGETFITAFGFVGKVDLRTGNYDWKFDNLYSNEHSSFNSFDSIYVGKDTVIFFSEHHSGKKDMVLVANESGQLLGIKK